MSTNVFELPAHDADGRDLGEHAEGAGCVSSGNAAEDLPRRSGADLGRGTRDTPRRFVRALVQDAAGYDGDPKLRTLFPAERPEGVDGRHAQIVEGPVGFYALCEHHASPFHGRAHIGYVAGDEILGISKLTRLVRLYARRFTVQERLAEEIADGLQQLAGARGVAVRLEAAHLCTAMRGVEEDGSVTITTVWRGLYDEDETLRSEFLTPRRSSYTSSVLAGGRRPASLARARHARRALRHGAIDLDEAVRRRELRRVTRRRRGRTGAAALTRGDRRRKRGRPLRPRAGARLLGRRRRRVGHAARLADGNLADRSRISACGRGAGRAASTTSTGQNSLSSSSSPPVPRSTPPIRCSRPARSC